MDINQWLQNTAEAAERPTLPDQLGFPAFLHPKDRPVGEPSAKRHGKRRVHSADSSILELEELAAKPLTWSKRPEQVPHDVDRSSSPDATNGWPTSEAVSGSYDSDRYRRKPRRKTRPGRYDAKPVKRASKGPEKRKQKRSSKDPKDSKPFKKRKKEKAGGLTAVVNEFHAKNVPRQRLTVRAQGLTVLQNTD
jgi:hypothetical protein